MWRLRRRPPDAAHRQELSVQQERVLLVGVLLPDGDPDPRDPLGELAGLAESAGAIIVGRILQRRHHVDASTYIGRGKVEEIAHTVRATAAQAVLFDNDLTPGQIRELESALSCKVVDRSELILDIFASRARTKAAKLQVELAQLEYTYPRLTRMWGHLERVGGGGAGAGAGSASGTGAGIGTRGPGEQQLEIDRRLVKRRISQLRRSLETIARRREREVAARTGEFTVSLVGYTNAGKSTLMNALTGAGVYAADQLFATLDTKTSRWNVGPGVPVLLSDTVGFIRDLPHHLVASFKATLAEAAHADLLLHVVDASSHRCEPQMTAVEKVLAEITAQRGREQPPPEVLLVFNKVDALADSGRLEGLRTLYPDAIAVSARTGRGLAELTEFVRTRAAGRHVIIEISGPLSDGRTPALLHQAGDIIAQQFTDCGWSLQLQIPEREVVELARLQGVRVRRVSPC